MDSEAEEVLAECSDEEEFSKIGVLKGNLWSPKFEVIESLYDKVKTNGNLELIWKCPGRKDPSQPEETTVEADVVQPTVAVKDTEADDFEFDEDLPPSNTRNPMKSGTFFKSKTPTRGRKTTLAGILSNMERHRIIEKMDTEQPADKAPGTETSDMDKKSSQS